jgi:hypothetical protein
MKDWQCGTDYGRGPDLRAGCIKSSHRVTWAPKGPARSRGPIGEINPLT